MIWTGDSKTADLEPVASGARGTALRCWPGGCAAEAPLQRAQHAQVAQQPGAGLHEHRAHGRCAGQLRPHRAHEGPAAAKAGAVQTCRLSRTSTQQASASSKAGGVKPSCLLWWQRWPPHCCAAPRLLLLLQHCALRLPPLPLLALRAEHCAVCDRLARRLHVRPQGQHLSLYPGVGTPNHPGVCGGRRAGASGLKQKVISDAGHHGLPRYTKCQSVTMWPKAERQTCLSTCCTTLHSQLQTLNCPRTPATRG